MPTVVSKRKFVCVDLKDNHNKYWDVTLFDNGDVLTEWGRVGYGETNGVHLTTQSKTHFGVGQHFIDSKLKEKYKKGYKEIDTIDAAVGSNGKAKVVVSNNLQKIAQDQIASSHPQTQKLVTYLTKVNAHNIYDVTGGKIEYDIDDGLLKTARGIITQNAIAEARGLLDEIVVFIHKKKFEDDRTIELVENFLTIVPQNMGMKRFTVQSFLPDVVAVQKQNDLLDALDASFAAALKAKPKSKKDAEKEKDAPKIFDVRLELIEDGKVMDKIQKQYEQSKNRQHQSGRFKIQCAYAVEVTSVAAAFDAARKKYGEVWRLWHGTKASNLLSILKSGLIIPPTSSPYVTGRMYGNGVYASDQSTKALNYATSFWGGKDEGRYFMFLLDMAMGKYYTPQSSGWGRVDGAYPKKGYDSTFAKAGASGVMNNEMIVYNIDQVNLVYLVEFK